MLTELAEEIHETAKAKGFWPEGRNLAEVCALIHSEVTELLEVFRGHTCSFAKSGNFEDADEIADILIRVLDLAAHLKIDVDVAVRNKMAYNDSRPYRHGKKF